MKKYLTLLLLLTALPAGAQSKKWTLDECLKYAVENSMRVKKSNAQNNIYHQNYMEAIGRLLPQLSAGTSGYFNFGRALDDETNTFANVNSFSNNYEAGGSLTLFDGLSSIRRVKMEKVTKLMGKQQLQQEKDLIAYETLEAYTHVVYYKQMVALAREQANESRYNLEQTQRMEELGVKGFPDVAEMRAKKAADAYNLTKRQNLLAIGIILLKEKMSFPIDEELDVDESSINSETTLNNLSAFDIYNQAQHYLPKAQIGLSSVKIKEAAYRMSKGALSPTISANGGYSTNFFFMYRTDYSPFKNQIKDKHGYYMGASLSIPIFSGFSRTATVKRGKADWIMAQAEYNESLQKLYSEIEQAVADLKGAEAECFQAKEQVEAMRVAHNVNQQKYEEGLISPLELHTGANRLLEAKAAQLNAQLTRALKQKMVLYYKGIPYITE